MEHKIVNTNELYHHGILGQKWGVRRYQNKDGTLTAEGRRHYGYGDSKKSNVVTTDQAKQQYYKYKDNLELKNFIDSGGSKEYFDKKDIEEAMKTGESNRQQIKEKMNKDLSSNIDNLKKLDYGSDEWYEERDRYYEKMDSYAKEWTEATLKDMNVSLKSVEENEEFSKWLGVGEGYVNTYSDYRSIFDPVRGDRDYDLPEPSPAYKDKSQLKTIMNKTGKNENEAKKLQSNIKEMEQKYEDVNTKYWDVYGKLAVKYDNDNIKIHSDPNLEKIYKEMTKIGNDYIKLKEDSGLW